MSRELVYGVGIYEVGEFSSKSTQYSLWVKMLQRCYSRAWKDRYPTYEDCSVSEEFKYFQNFSKWCETQIGFGSNGYQLDKDIIYIGNKQYNRDSCAFVPAQINKLLNNNGVTRGEYPVGVCWHRASSKLQVRLKKGGKYHYFGLYDSVEDASTVYKAVKESYVKEVAERYKDFIDPRVYQALMKWKVGEKWNEPRY